MNISQQLCLLGLSLLVYILVRFYLFIKKRVGKERSKFFDKIPEPRGNFFFGVALEFTDTSKIIQVLTKFHKEFGPTFTARAGPIERAIMTTDYKFVEFLLKTNKVMTKSENYSYLKPWLGSGLLINNGDQWRIHRRIITPAFHFEILKEFVGTFEASGDVLVEKLAKYGSSKSVDVYPLLSLCTLDVICETAMGTKIDAQNNKNLNYVWCVKEMCRIITERGLNPLKLYPLTFPLTKDYYKQKAYVKTLHRFSNDVVNKKIKDLNNRDLSGKKKMAFLDLLLQSSFKQGSLDVREIREEVDTFMFAGHDTSATAISYVLYCLAKYPEIQEQAYTEQKEIFGSRENSTVTHGDLSSMKYLELVIKETLRLYPTVPMLGRYTTEPVEFDGATIPAFVNIAIFVYGIHRNPEYFPDPEKFDPERFRNNDGALPVAYIPFSAGFRNCIGQKFAMLEMKSVISKIVRNFQLLPAIPHHELELCVETVLKSRNGIKIGFRKRTET